MGLSDFWLQFNNGKKEQLNDTKHGVRKEQVDKKFYNLFDAYDANNDGTLEENEVQTLFHHLKNFAGDNVLDSTENLKAKSIFADQVNINDADFQGFVKSVSDASADIISSEEKATADGGKEIKTEYKDGITETIAYYSNGDFKWKKTEKRFEKTSYELVIDGKTKELTEEEFQKALNKLEENSKTQAQTKIGIEGQKIIFPLQTQNAEVKRSTKQWEEHTQEYSPRFIAEKLGVDINTEEGQKIVERMSYLTKEALDQIKDGAELKDVIAKNDLSTNFDNISNVLEMLYGVTLRNEEEFEASKPQREKIIQQIQTVGIMSELYARVAEFNDTYTDNQGLFGMGAEGIGYLLNKVGIQGENHYQWADSCREFIEKINNFKVLNPDKFDEEFKELTGKDKFNIDALQKMLELSKNGKSQDEYGNYTEEYKQAVKDFSNFDVNNPNANAWYHPDNLISGFGEAIIMIMTLGWGAETKAGQMLATSTMATFGKAGVAIASKQVNNKLLQGALRLSGQGVKLLGPALNEGTKMYAYTAVMGTAGNVANRAIKFDSEDNTLDKFIQTEAMVLDSAKGSFGFGAFAGVFGSTVTQKVMQRASRVSQKVGTALSDKFAKGAVDANEVFTTILEKSAPTKIAEVAAFATDVLGFTAFESVLAIVKNLDNYPDGYSVEDLTNVIWEELKSQGYNLFQIKIVAWLLSSRSARMQATRYMKDAMPQLKGASIEWVNEGKDGYKINLPDGRKIECKNSTEYISALHLMVRGETAYSKKFDTKTKPDVSKKQVVSYIKKALYKTLALDKAKNIATVGKGKNLLYPHNRDQIKDEIKELDTTITEENASLALEYFQKWSERGLFEPGILMKIRGMDVEKLKTEIEKFDYFSSLPELQHLFSGVFSELVEKSNVEGAKKILAKIEKDNINIPKNMDYYAPMLELSGVADVVCECFDNGFFEFFGKRDAFGKETNEIDYARAFKALRQLLTFRMLDSRTRTVPMNEALRIRVDFFVKNKDYLIGCAENNSEDILKLLHNINQWNTDILERVRNNPKTSAWSIGIISSVKNKKMHDFTNLLLDDFENGKADFDVSLLVQFLRYSSDNVDISEKLYKEKDFNVTEIINIDIAIDDAKKNHCPNAENIAIILCRDYKKLEIEKERIPFLIRNAQSIDYKQLGKLRNIIGKEALASLSDNEVIVACQFANIKGVKNINELSASSKKQLLRSLVASNAGLFDVTPKLKELFPMIPTTQEEYCSLLPSIVRSLGIETTPLTPEQRIQMFNSSMNNLSLSLGKLSDQTFANMTITQEFSREDFIHSVLEKTKGLSALERQKVYDYFGFELHHNKNNETGYTITGYPVNLNNGKKLAEITSSQTKEVVEALRPDVVRYSTQNRINCNNPKIEQLLNEVIETLPELHSLIGKSQHGTHDFDVMQHSLKVMQKISQDPKYKFLNDSDKKIMQLAALLHDITKSEGRRDVTHANESSFDTFFIAKKFNLTKEEEIKLYTLIKHHEWLEYVNTARSEEDLTKRLQSVAYDLRHDNLFDMALMFTHADLKAVKVDDSFHDKVEGKSRTNFDGTIRSFGDSADAYADKIREYVAELKKSQPLLPVTKIPRTSRIKQAITKVNSDGSTNIKGVYQNSDGLIIIKYNEVEDWELIGFPKGSISHGIDAKGLNLRGNSTTVNTGNIKFFVHGLDYENQLAKFDAFSLVDSEVLLSVSYAERPESKYRFFRTQGVVLDIPTKYVHGGGNTDAGSGCGKFVSDFKRNYIFGGNRESDRLYVSELIKDATGMSDKEYINFVAKYENKPMSEIQPPELQETIIKALATINSNVRKGNREYNEMYGSNPSDVMAVFAYNQNYHEKIGNIMNLVSEERLEFLRRYALKRDIPMIVFGD